LLITLFFVAFACAWWKRDDEDYNQLSSPGRSQSSTSTAVILPFPSMRVSRPQGELPKAKQHA